MRLLLDTHVVLWRYGAMREVGERTRAALTAAETVSVSAMAFVEIGVKAGTGKLLAPRHLERRLREDGIDVLAVEPTHGLALEHLPLLHRDPFDRILVVQAMTEELTLVTADAEMQRYDVPVLDPRR